MLLTQIIDIIQTVQQQLATTYLDLDGIADLRYFLFIGRGSWDGHGILLEDGPAIFIDMTLMTQHLSHPRFIPQVHLLHETLHALHYNKRPELYPGSPKSPRQHLIHQLIAEGLASFLSWRLSGCTCQQALWFGYLRDDAYERWRDYAQHQASKLYERLLQVSHTQDKELNDRLFHIPDDMVRSRLGYLYGFEIAERLLGTKSLSNLLTFREQQWIGYIDQYFIAPINLETST